MFYKFHKYVGIFPYALELIMLIKDFKKITIRADKRPRGKHEKRYNAPVAAEIAIVMMNKQHEHHDIILHQSEHLPANF